MAWGFWSKLKDGIVKLIPKVLPIVKKGAEVVYNLAKDNQDKIQEMKPFKNVPVKKVFDIADKFIHPIFK